MAVSRDEFRERINAAFDMADASAISFDPPHAVGSDNPTGGVRVQGRESLQASELPA